MQLCSSSMDINLYKLRELVIDREAWHPAVHVVTKSWTWLSDWTELKYLTWSDFRVASLVQGFPGGSDGKPSAGYVGDLGSIPVSGRSPGEGNCNALKYSCLENSMAGGDWWLQSMGRKESYTTEPLHFHFNSSGSSHYVPPTRLVKIGHQPLTLSLDLLTFPCEAMLALMLFP